MSIDLKLVPAYLRRKSKTLDTIDLDKMSSYDVEIYNEFNNVMLNKLFYYNYTVNYSTSALGVNVSDVIESLVDRGDVRINSSAITPGSNEIISPTIIKHVEDDDKIRYVVTLWCYTGSGNICVDNDHALNNRIALWIFNYMMNNINYQEVLRNPIFLKYVEFKTSPRMLSNDRL